MALITENYTPEVVNGSIQLKRQLATSESSPKHETSIFSGLLSWHSNLDQVSMSILTRPTRALSQSHIMLVVPLEASIKYYWQPAANNGHSSPLNRSINESRF